MVPSSFAGVGIFLLLVAPGITYELLRQRTQLPRGESTFIEISRVLLFGVVYSGAAILPIALIAAIEPRSVVDLSAWVRDGDAYVADHIHIVGWTLILELALASLLAIAASDLGAHSPVRLMHDGNLWHALTQTWAGRGVETYLDVRMKDGTSIVGRWVGHTNEPDPLKREVALSDVSVRHPGQIDLAALGKGWKFIVLSGSEVAHIAGYYHGRRPDPTRPTWGARILSSIRHNCTSWRFAVSAILALLVAALLIGWMQPDDIVARLILRR